MWWVNAYMNGAPARLCPSLEQIPSPASLGRVQPRSARYPPSAGRELRFLLVTRLPRHPRGWHFRERNILGEPTLRAARDPVAWTGAPPPICPALPLLVPTRHRHYQDAGVMDNYADIGIIIHLLRNSFEYASEKGWAQIAKDLKPVCTAASDAGLRRWTGSPSSARNGRSATRPSSGCGRTRGRNSSRSCGSTGKSGR
jgi:hypothetical protein